MPVSEIAYFDIPYQSPEFTSIHALKLDNPDELNSKTLVVEGSQNLYMSEDNIYLSYTEYINEWEIRNKLLISMMMGRLTEADKKIVEKIKTTDDEVLSQQEKESKILSIIQSYMQYLPQDEQEAIEDELQELLQEELEQYDSFEYTILHRISADHGDVEVEATGKVPGHIINQFSMDEFGGILRIATTESQRWSTFAEKRAPEQVTESVNNIYTLNQELEIIDSLTGLAEGEQIYSTRFMGERLYMVTFRQVDPFFVIDLSNPDNIKELGKLKIPGFSRYLHPYDENTIIGIGRQATETGRTQGLKISLFDVSDVEHPAEIAKWVSEERYASSTAEYEHKAFLFSKEKELLVIPAYNYKYRGDGNQDETSYNGAMVFKITKDDIEMRGIIDHSLGKAEYYSPQVERSLYIEELLYTKSLTLLRINKLDDLGKVKNIELAEGSSGPYPVY